MEFFHLNKPTTMDQLNLNQIAQSLTQRIRATVSTVNLDDPETYDQHAQFVALIGNLLLEREGKEFVFDDNNKKVLRFLMLYFNNSKQCECMDFGADKMSLHKNLLLYGKPGTGKSLIMKIYSHYCNETNNPLKFTNIGATELLNYYKQYGHINPYTYNNQGEINLEGQPKIYCLNDIGIDVMDQKNYGTDMNKLIDEWLYSRYEIWLNRGYRFFITTNQTFEQLNKCYDFRIVDRFKSFNLIPMIGESRR